jgi:hypothetical protein
VEGLDDLRRRVTGEDWGGRCPSSWMASEVLLWAADLLRQARISPLAGWPDDYTPAVVAAMEALHEAREEAARR